MQQKWGEGMVGDAGVEPTAFGSGDTGKRLPQIAVYLLNLHQFSRLLKVSDKKPASLPLILLQGLSRNLTNTGDKVKKR